MHRQVTNRRTVLSLIALATPTVRVLTSDAAPLAGRYASNTELYADPGLVEGADYSVRYKRHEMFDDSLSGRPAYRKTAIVAPHGGGIEVGTSELCLAIAGYHPASRAVSTPTYDYWMFEGLRASNNDVLHVTSTRCDDPVARSLCGGCLNALGLHGCSPAEAGLPDTARAVLVGGRNDTFKRYLREELAGQGLQTLDAADGGSLGGVEPDNIANRTLLGMGGQLEITTALRAAMFGENTRPQRKNTTTALFWDFVAGTRSAIARLEGR
jgi:phage replication-related protein YjqB (UPF0714/DUF867 family)